MLNKFNSSFFIIMLTVFLLPVTSLAKQDINIDIDQEDITIEKISEEQAFKNLINNFGYAHTEAKNMINKHQASRGTWVTISYRDDPNVILQGQAKLDNHDRVLDVAPRLNVVERSGECDVTSTRNNRFSIVSPSSVRFQLDYRLVCGMFPAWITIDSVKEIAPYIPRQI